MFKENIKLINEDIKQTKKAIISLGCSFVQGHGAISQEIYDNYKWYGTPKNGSINWKFNEVEKKQIKLKYPEIDFYIDSDSVNFSFHENKNSFVNILCKKYF
jgi:hypothetical protein